MSRMSPVATAALSSSREGARDTSAGRGRAVTNAGRWTETGSTWKNDAWTTVSPEASHELVTRWRPDPASPGTDSPLRLAFPAASGDAEPTRVPSKKK
jgi:hypothetical protein